MRIPALLLLGAAVTARAGGPCDDPAAVGHHTVQTGRLIFCPALHAAPQLDGTSGLPAAGALTAVVELAAGAPATRPLLAAHAQEGLFRSDDGGGHWQRVSGAGSGLEQTSQHAAALLTAKTSWGGLDVIAGMAGGANGGVYLSGDGGFHWMQLQAGYDPANLALSALVTTSCPGCPVQYYSGSYGGGLYTRTIAVSPPPAITGWNFGNAAGACATAPPGGPASGGQPFALCGKNFQPGVIVQFGETELKTCKATATRITCAAASPAASGNVKIKVRNPDTRTGALPRDYAYAPPRAGTP